MRRWSGWSVLAVVMPALCCARSPMIARGDVIQLFDSSQTWWITNSGVTSDTMNCEGYLFTYTRDKLFTGGTGTVIGRGERVHWPDGIEAQAVTTPPDGGAVQKATITIKRLDNDLFDLPAFDIKLLANTAGAGGAIEVMPKLNGEDGFNNPLAFDVTGVGGQTFSFVEFPPYWWQPSTHLLKGFDTYTMTLYVDYALTGINLDGAPTPEPTSAVGLLLGGVGTVALRRRRPAWPSIPVYSSAR